MDNAFVIQPVCLRLKSSLSLFSKSCKTCCVVDSDLGEHLSVESDASLLETVHKCRIVHTIHLAGSGNSCDPELSEITLLESSADISVVAGLHYGFLSHLEMLALCAPVTLSEL